MEKTHDYSITLTWTGNLGSGTSGYRAYGRDHEIGSGDKPPIPGSSDPVFRGDPSRWNPEELLVSALSGCHLLSYVHVCADAGVVVVDYVDEASGSMEIGPDGSGRFTRVTLHPKVTIAPGSDPQKALEAHHTAHAKCFVANSVNFPVDVEPQIQLAVPA